MSEPELTFHELTRHLRLRELPESEPSSDLWQRIASAHHRRGRRARLRRGIIGSSIAAAALAALLIVPGWLARPATDGAIDWKARAQALELQLHTLEASGSAHVVSAGFLDAQSEIARIDDALQTAYDTGAEKEQLALLWKRRSELLGTLISVRQQHVEISRI